MNIHIFWVAVAALGALVAPAGGQETWDLEDVEREVRLRSNEIRAARAQLERAEAGARRARSIRLPSIGLQAGLTAADDPVFAFGSKLRQGRFAQEDLALGALNDPGRVEDWSAGLAFAWNGLSPSAWTHAEGARLQAESASWAVAGAEAQAVFRARVLFHQSVAAEARVGAASLDERAKTEAVSVLRRRVDEGSAVPAELLAAEAELQGARAVRVAAEGAWIDARSRLAVALALGPEELPALRYDPSPLEMPTDLGRAGVRADVRALAARADASARQAEAARRARFGSVETFAAWNHHADGPFADGRGRWTAGVRVAVPLFSGFAIESGIQAARAEARASEVQLEQATREADAALEEARRGVRTALDVAQATQAAAAAAEEAERLARRRFEEGLATTLDLLDAQARAEGFRFQAVQSRAQYEIALARLAWASASDEERNR